MNKFFTQNNIKLDLVTSDGGLEGNDLYLLQKLEYAQAISCIYLCSVGKSVVVKHFTPVIYEMKETLESTGYFISFIYLYALCFEKIHLIKPNSSNKKSGEFYLVGHKKKDIPDKMLEYYLKRMDDFKINQPLFYKKDIPEDFYYQILEFLRIHIGNNNKYVSHQIYVINCMLSDRKSEIYDKASCELVSPDNLKKLSDKKINEWLKTYT